MKEHELTPFGYASSVVAGCLLGFYKDGEGQKLLDKVMSNPGLRKHVPEEDIAELKEKGFKIAENKEQK